jgi:hypothetical protein
MQACLQKIVLESLLYSIKVAFFKPYLSVFLNHYFINYYFTILERIDFKLYFYYFMQAKPLCYAHKVLFKNTFYFENMFLVGLKPCLEF